MQISDLSVKRPVFASVIAMLIAVVGLIGFFSLSVREYPDVDPPIVSVSTSYAGASAEVIESRITEPVEQQIAGIQGVERINSTGNVVDASGNGGDRDWLAPAEGPGAPDSPDEVFGFCGGAAMLRRRALDEAAAALLELAARLIRERSAAQWRVVDLMVPGVRGQHAEAARALGISPQAVSRALIRTGWAEQVRAADAAAALLERTAA